MDLVVYFIIVVGLKYPCAGDIPDKEEDGDREERGEDGDDHDIEPTSGSLRSLARYSVGGQS